MAENVGETFVQEFVIGLGLLSGMGIDPDGMIIKTLGQIIPTLNSSVGLKIFFFLLPLIITVMSIIVAFVVGGWIGIIAIGLAFVGGIFIKSSVGGWLLIFGILIGLVAPNLKNRKSKS
jgi:hypothetical protein